MHAIHCPACGLFGRRRRQRARDADERLLVNWAMWQGAKAREFNRLKAEAGLRKLRQRLSDAIAEAFDNTSW